MKNVAVLAEDRPFALLFSPHPGELTALGAGGIDWCINGVTSVKKHITPLAIDS